MLLAARNSADSQPICSLTDRVDPKDVARIHEILDRLSAEEKAKLNLVETDGERYSNHGYVIIAALRI